MARVTEQNVIDIIDTAMYGGITYWARSLTDEQWETQPYDDYRDRALVERETGRILWYGLADVRAAIWGLYRDPSRYRLSKESYVIGYIRDAFRYADSDGIDCGFIDSDAADVIMQAALLREVIYG